MSDIKSFFIGLSRLVLLSGILGFVFSGCAWIVQPPRDDPQARVLIDELNGRNLELQNFKGMSHVRVATRSRTLSGRIAWAAALPDRLRLAWLNPTGQPVTSVAADGRTLTVLNHHEHKRYILRQSPDVLKDVIHVPIGIEDFLTLLSGRPLIPEFDAAEQRAEGTDFMILLKNRWRQPLAELETDDRHRPIRQKIFDDEGDLAFRIQWKAWQQIADYAIPREMAIVAANGESVDIRIERMIPQRALPPDIFELPITDAEK